MKLVLVLVMFLLSVSPVLAATIRVGNLTIILPNITINTTKLPVMRLNQTQTVDVLGILDRLGVSDLLKDTLSQLFQSVREALARSIVKSIEMLPDLIQVMVRGNVNRSY